MKKKSYLAAALGMAVLLSVYGASSPSRTADAADSGAVIEAVTDTDYAIYVNGAGLQLDAPAGLAGSTMLVPVRNIAEALGAVVTYEADTESVTAVKDGITVSFRIGSRTALRNGTSFTLEAEATKHGSVTLVPVRFFSEAFGTVVKWDGVNHRVSIDHESYLLPAVVSYDNLKKLLKENENQSGMYAMENGIAVSMAKGAAADMVFTAPAAASREAAAAKTSAQSEAASTASNGSPDYSGTNVQVDGVDEADVVKTDGEYIYQVNRERIMIARAYPADELSLTAALSMADYKLQPQELYVDGNRLTVIGRSYDQGAGAVSGGASSKSAAAEKRVMILPYHKSTVKAVVFDITSKANPKALKEVEIEGDYVTSRKIGDHLYIVGNQYVNRYQILNENAVLPAPAYRDSSISADFMPADYKDIRYFPDSFLDSYMLVAGINTAQPDQKTNVSVYLGSAQNVYASDKNLYVAAAFYKPVPQVMGEGVNGTSGPVQDIISVNSEQTSVAYKFVLDQGQVRFAAKGEVPGTVLNQFSMDEYNGYFRIATTKGDMWRNDAFTSKNNVYVLDESMNISGKVEDIAPGERIYSVRFMGGRGYMVTFKKVDPLFVLDLSNPFQPSILGKLKIPGYSDYLHPYDETHMIGFGKDAVEAANEWETAGVSAPSTTAYYQGMKIAMFDVSDVSNPKELFKTGIGDRGTDSELLHNHKALLFSREKNLMAFPVTVMEVSPELKKQQGVTAYGQFTFQGAYVYKVDLAEGFKLRGTITHLSDAERSKAGDHWYNAERNINRVLYIGDTLYTTSQSEIRANGLDTLQERKRLSLQAE
jgi:inhibitor of cysteine peptidase